MVRVRERTIPTERPPRVGEVIWQLLRWRVPRGQMTDPYGRILGFLDRSPYFSIKYLLSCTHEAEWTPFQTHYFLFSGSAGNQTRASGSVAKNTWPLDHRGGHLLNKPKLNILPVIVSGCDFMVRISHDGTPKGKFWNLPEALYDLSTRSALFSVLGIRKMRIC
jgi:hypothetical protein